MTEFTRFSFLDPEGSLEIAASKCVHDKNLGCVFRLVDQNPMYGKHSIDVSGLEVAVRAFRVTKLTPKGLWYMDHNKERLQVFNNYSMPQVFKPDMVEKMIEQYKRRKMAQLHISERNYSKAKRCLELISMRDRRPRKQPIDAWGNEEHTDGNIPY